MVIITIVYSQSSGTPLVRPSPLQQESGLSRGVASVRGKNQYIYVKIYIVKWPFQRGWPLIRVASQKGLKFSWLKHFSRFIKKICHL